MERLIQALDADFVGYEDVQAMCLAAPKYGNDDERADFCVGEIFTHWPIGVLPETGSIPQVILPKRVSYFSN